MSPLCVYMTISGSIFSQLLPFDPSWRETMTERRETYRELKELGRESNETVVSRLEMGWACMRDRMGTLRDRIAFWPSRMRDRSLAWETIASRRVPSSSRDGLSRIRAKYISCQKLETYLARMRDGFSLQCRAMMAWGLWSCRCGKWFYTDPPKWA